MAGTSLRIAVLGAVIAVLAAVSVAVPRVTPPAEAAAPSNDNLASALEVGFQPYTNVQSTVDAGIEGSELVAYSGCQGDDAGAYTMGSTVWYKYTHAAAPATLQVDTLGPGLVDTVIRVSTGPASSPTHASLTQVACGDQEWGQFSAALTFAAAAGQTYYIQVGGWSGAFGTIALNISPILSAAGGRYVVTSNADNGDATPDGLCADGPGGMCTFREAIQESNALIGTDVITFEAGGGAQVTITPATPLPAFSNVVIDARTENISEGAPAVMFDGVNAGCSFADVLQPVGLPVSIRGFSIVRSCANAILLTSGNNIIQGNYLGVHLDGGTDMGNNGRGVYVLAGSGNVIGGTTASARNVISGNGTGVFIDGATNPATNHRVIGNYIGTNAAGTFAVPNDNDGIAISGTAGASGNIIGETALNALPLGGRNLISGNGGNGVSIQGGNAVSNSVSGNFIGTNAAGTSGIANSQRGVQINFGADANLIGGAQHYYRNVISGNTLGGVRIEGAGATANEVSGNYIGTEATGTTDLGNGGAGVLIENASGNRVGNTVFAPGLAPGNVISGNPHGLMIYGDGADANEVWGNIIGLNAAGDADLGNDDVGIWVLSGADNNQIGGASSGVRNVVSGNNRGIAMFDSGTAGNVVEGNYLGTNLSGSAAIGNAAEGVSAGYGASGNYIGGTSTEAAMNLISGNGQNGVRIGEGAPSNSNTIKGNLIGTNAVGMAAVPNGVDGVWVLSGSSGTLVENNFIAGNVANGINLDGATGNTIRSNQIGTNAGATAAVHNGANGIRISGSANVIGGTGIQQGNVISGNTANGVSVTGAGASGNQLLGNYIGTNGTGQVAIGNGDNGVLISDAPNNAVGTSSASGGNVISGNGISGATDGGVRIVGGSATGNFVEGNKIGTDVDGTFALANFSYGVLVESANGNAIGTAAGVTVGGNCDGACNVISGNAGPAVKVTGGGVFQNVIRANHIGTDGTGTAAIPNDGGVLLDGVQGVDVGGGAPEARNLISGNDFEGVEIAGGGPNYVRGNYIGTNASGGGALSNSGSGVWVNGTSGANIIGGTTAGERNVISGNGEHGVSFADGAFQSAVQGNYIGTNAAGSAGFGNGFDGVSVQQGTTNILIGGTTNTSLGACTGACNLISGQTTGFGIVVHSSNNIIKGNWVGVKSDGLTGLGNNRGLLLYDGAGNNVVGGNGAGEGNVIAFNANQGVVVDGGVSATNGNTINGNSIHGNGSLGIALVSGGNGGIAAPFNLGFVPAANQVTGESGCAGCTVDVFSDGADEGRFYHGSTATDGFGDWSFIGVIPGPNITATITGPTGTSEFSPAISCPDFENDDICDAADPEDDGDGYTDVAEGLIGTGAMDPCGYDGWPSNVWDASPSDNKLDVQDLISFIAPDRRLDTSPGPGSKYLARWDLAPGPNSPFPNHISIFDITTVLNGVPGSPAYPPMFEGPRAFGKACPVAP